MLKKGINTKVNIKGGTKPKAKRPKNQKLNKPEEVQGFHKKSTSR